MPDEAEILTLDQLEALAWRTGAAIHIRDDRAYLYHDGGTFMADLAEVDS